MELQAQLNVIVTHTTASIAQLAKLQILMPDIDATKVGTFNAEYLLWFGYLGGFFCPNI